MAVTARRRLIPALALLAGGLAGPASGAPWGAFGGDPGRSGHQPAGSFRKISVNSPLGFSLVSANCQRPRTRA